MENETSTDTYGRNDVSIKKAKNDIELAIVFVVFILMDIFGNALVITVLLTKMRRSFKTMSILLTSLAIADLMQGVFVGIPYAARRFVGTWMTGSLVCKVYSFTRAIAGEVSVFTLAIIGFERYRTIRKRDNKPDKTVYLYLALTVTWIYLIAVGLPYAIVFDLYERQSGIICAFRPDSEDNTGFVDFVMKFGKIGNFAIPLTLVIVSYCGVIYQMKKTQNRIQAMQGPASHNAKQKQVTRLCVTVMLMFLIFWMPMRIVGIARVLDPKNSVWAVAMAYSRIGTMLGSCLNPIIYGLMWKQFRDNTIEMLSPVLVICFPKWISKKLSERGLQVPSSNQLTASNTNASTSMTNSKREIRRTKTDRPTLESVIVSVEQQIRP